MMLPELCFHIAKQFFIILMKLGGLLRNTLLHACLLYTSYAAVGQGISGASDLYRVIFPGTAIWDLRSTAPA